MNMWTRCHKVQHRNDKPPPIRLLAVREKRNDKRTNSRANRPSHSGHHAHSNCSSHTVTIYDVLIKFAEQPRGKRNRLVR